MESGFCENPNEQMRGPEKSKKYEVETCENIRILNHFKNDLNMKTMCMIIRSQMHFFLPLHNFSQHSALLEMS